MDIAGQIKSLAAKALEELYDYNVNEAHLPINITKPEFEGDYTLVLFSFIKQLKKSPEQLGNELGKYLVEKNNELFTAYNVIKGFLNLTISDNYWIQLLRSNYADQN